MPDYTGIRPKLHGPGEPQPDFRIEIGGRPRPRRAREPARHREPRPHLRRSPSVTTSRRSPKVARMRNTLSRLVRRSRHCSGRHCLQQAGTTSAAAARRPRPTTRPSPPKARRASRSRPTASTCNTACTAAASRRWCSSTAGPATRTTGASRCRCSSRNTRWSRWISPATAAPTAIAATGRIAALRPGRGHRAVGRA